MEFSSVPGLIAVLYLSILFKIRKASRFAVHDEFNCFDFSPLPIGSGRGINRNLL
jgi:hypothetical protein